MKKCPSLTSHARLFVTLLAVGGLVLLSGCAGMKKRNGAGGSGDGGLDSDRVTGTPLPDRQEGVSFFSANVDRNQFKPVYFEFDGYRVRGDQQALIEEIARFQKSTGQQIIIAGFTDERGTAEYNRALGERRALSVREDLIAAGASAGALQTVSFGAEMPAEDGHNESAWAQNRRAEFGVVR